MVLIFFLRLHFLRHPVNDLSRFVTSHADAQNVRRAPLPHCASSFKADCQISNGKKYRFLKSRKFYKLQEKEKFALQLRAINVCSQSISSSS